MPTLTLCRLMTTAAWHAPAKTRGKQLPWPPLHCTHTMTRGRLWNNRCCLRVQSLPGPHLNRSEITADPGGHRPQHPCAQGRTRAKQDQAQASAPGQNRTRFVGGATMHGRRTRQKRANTDAVRGWRVHTADDTPSRNAATRSKHFMCQGDIRPRAAAGSSRSGTTQAVAATTGTGLVGNVASNTASAWSDRELSRVITTPPL